MKKQFVIIGLAIFGQRAIEALINYDVDILIIDKDEEVINTYKNRVTGAYVVDINKTESVEKIIPSTIDTAIIDLGKNIQASFLITNTLKKLNIPEIVVKAESDQHGEILNLVGATTVVFPHKEAVKRIIPMLISPSLYDYFPMSANLIIAEVEVPAEFFGKSLIEADLRRLYQINVIAFKNKSTHEYHYSSGDYIFNVDEPILIVGNENNISKFIKSPITPRKGGFFSAFKNLFYRD